jgi:regulator of sigma E protease
MSGLTQLLNSILYVVAVAGMFLLLIAPHEAGHFAFAKLFKVRVIEFSIGAGTKLWSFTRNGTLYALRAFPILGYVRMGGMEAGDFDEPNSFHRKSALQRILILIGGPLANFLVAIIVVAGFNMTQLNDDPGKVVGVVKDSPAAAAGFEAGDRLLTVNGKKITAPDQIRKEEAAAPGAPVVIGGVHPNGKPFEYSVTPICKDSVCQVGFKIRGVLTPQMALLDGVLFPVQAVSSIVQGLTQLVTGQVPGGLFGPNGLTGPIGIADVTYQSVNQGFANYAFLVALLSVALGFTNLLPLPALDGGRIVVVLVEVLRRRPFDRAMELNVQRWGLAALLGLAAFIALLDIQRIVTGTFGTR